MKLQFETKVMVLAQCEPTKSKDGQTTYYKATVMQGQEAGQISVSEEIYNRLEVGKVATVICEYNDAFKSLKVVHYNVDATPHAATTAPKGDK